MNDFQFDDATLNDKVNAMLSGVSVDFAARLTVTDMLAHRARLLAKHAQIVSRHATAWEDRADDLDAATRFGRRIVRNEARIKATLA